MPPQVEEILGRSCNDCHSNLTEWPWYTNVAPVSWLIAHHVNEGRRHLNFSEWLRPDVQDAAKYTAHEKFESICKEKLQTLGDMPAGVVHVDPPASAAFHGGRSDAVPVGGGGDGIAEIGKLGSCKNKRHHLESGFPIYGKAFPTDVSSLRPSTPLANHRITFKLLNRLRLRSIPRAKARRRIKRDLAVRVLLHRQGGLPSILCLQRAHRERLSPPGWTTCRLTR